MYKHCELFLSMEELARGRRTQAINTKVKLQFAQLLSKTNCYHLRVINVGAFSDPLQALNSSNDQNTCTYAIKSHSPRAKSLSASLQGVAIIADSSKFNSKRNSPRTESGWQYVIRVLMGISQADYTNGIIKDAPNHRAVLDSEHFRSWRCYPFPHSISQMIFNM